MVSPCVCLTLCVREWPLNPLLPSMTVCVWFHLCTPVALLLLSPCSAKSRVLIPHFLASDCPLRALCVAFVPEVPGNFSFQCLLLAQPVVGSSYPPTAQGPRGPPVPLETAHRLSVLPPSLATLPSPLEPSNVSRHTTRALAPVSFLFSSKFRFPGCKYQGNVSVSSDTDSRSSRPPPVLSHVSWQV